MEEKHENNLIASRHADFLPKSYVSFDLEATGNSKFNYMIEISAFKVIDFEVVDEYSSLIRPPRSRKVTKSSRLLSECEEFGDKIYYIDKFIESLTGIDNISIHKAEKEADVIKKFRDFVGDSILVGHGVNNDINLLKDTYMRVFGEEFTNKYIDTQALGVFLDDREYSLVNLCNKYSIENIDTHRASSDAYRTNLCYINLYKDIEAKYSSIPDKLFANWIEDRHNKQNRILKNRTMKSLNAKNWNSHYENMKREDYLALDIIGNSLSFDMSVSSDDFNSFKKRLKKFDIRLHRDVFSNTNFLIVDDIATFSNQSKKLKFDEKNPNLKRVLSFNIKGKKIKVIDKKLLTSKIDYLEEYTARHKFDGLNDELSIKYPSKTKGELVDQFSVLGSKFYLYNDLSTMNSNDLKIRLINDGAEVRDVIDEDLDYIIVGEGRNKNTFYNSEECNRFLEILAYGNDVKLLNEENFKLCINLKVKNTII
ncbi:PolC-type DNA polymerase III [Peptostreptococcus anaerobius]|uniref:Exonuclease, DNA polymerase III, epsilon subunit family n=1 Tax=Peptostreptococcus anaerobius TaxID=1261 RepID=A0A135YNA7_9FIRM|nr:3'-5' exonuclease [Peptostreptococcus anaerobius]KXI10902.1 exonuclease, DNA polymerase III, epsilon subunit family [Peptostreptococcus anaerobius]MDU5095312.1 3'-5' exonuclease [Peptostreptococcus anaerobius]CCY50214.1 dNA polymerase III PolC-type [Peptostreptococcus anaerobius CAG:621]